MSEPKLRNSVKRACASVCLALVMALPLLPQAYARGQQDTADAYRGASYQPSCCLGETKAENATAVAGKYYYAVCNNHGFSGWFGPRNAGRRLGEDRTIACKSDSDTAANFAPRVATDRVQFTWDGQCTIRCSNGQCQFFCDHGAGVAYSSADAQVQAEAQLRQHASSSGTVIEGTVRVTVRLGR
jgi:hypothetical protein